MQLYEKDQIELITLQKILYNFLIYLSKKYKHEILLIPKNRSYSVPFGQEVDYLHPDLDNTDFAKTLSNWIDNYEQTENANAEKERIKKVIKEILEEEKNSENKNNVGDA